ncbi:MAG: hypothetical protein RMM17_08505 [Acidobacteriota bacterium]|nr:hypothetical protein [Blastocatellia bacterium]MDW8412708.1 hypothetical protein [Acidobacteriota bacterium]
MEDRVCRAVMLVSASVLMLELILTRIFSVTMYYHFAFLAISLALFGSGASGIYVYLLPKIFTAERASRQCALSATLAAIAVIIAVISLLRLDLNLTSIEGNYAKLLAIYIVAGAPFFSAGLCISLALTHYAKAVSKLYFYDLAGAAFGCLLVIPALNLLGGPAAMLAISILLAAAASCFSSGYRIITFSLSAITVAMIAYDIQSGALSITNAKGESNIIFQKWNSFSRVTVSGNPEKDSYLQIKIDSDAATAIPRHDWMKQVEKAPISVTNLAYQLKKDVKSKVLIIGPGGGPDVINALSAGAEQVIGVEINPIIVRDIMQDKFKNYSGGLYNHPKVRVVVDEGRSYIRSTQEKYDVIQATLVDTWAATSAGAFALTENNLYTVEAFIDYVTHLTDDGLLTMTRWMLEPPQQDLRLISLTRAMMQNLGIPHPEEHIMMIKDRGQSDRLAVTYIFKRSPFTKGEVKLIKQICDQEGFGIVYLPDHPQDNIFTKLITAPDPNTIYASYPLNIEPTYDNSPFFFNNVRISEYYKAFTLNYESQKTNLGVSVLAFLIVTTAGLVLLFLIGPLVLLRRDVISQTGLASLNLVLYFACLGLAFITIEISLVQKFTLFLGHPVYSLTVILFSVLIFSSLGSYLSARITDSELVSWLLRIIAAIWLIVLSYIALLPYIFYGYVSLPLWMKIPIAVALLAPLALMMGMPMPLGIRLTNIKATALIPWAWGINGATSVLGSVSTFALAIALGFNQALVAGLIFYGIAAALFYIANRLREQLV